MKGLRQTFNVHPVGQGLFYSGVIEFSVDRIQERHFNFVFDCGSLTKGACETEIEELLDSESYKNNEPIDILVVSHFDADHVNQIEKLLEGGRQVKNLVLPFMGFEERLFLALRFSDSNNTEGIDDSNDFPVRFIIDPIGTLNNNLGGDSSVFILDSDPDTPVFSPEKENKGDGNQKSGNESDQFDFFFIGRCKDLDGDDKTTLVLDNSGPKILGASL